MGSRAERYFDLIWALKIVFWLDICSRDGVLTGHGLKKYYSDWTWTVEIVYSLDIVSEDGVLAGHVQVR